MTPLHRAGFVQIVGKPNAGKSTLFNALLGRLLAIATPKAQTTRQNLIGVHSTDHYQIIYTDTPGCLDPSYLLQNAMMQQVRRAIRGSDLILWVVDPRDEGLPPLYPALVGAGAPPHLLVLNKLDLFPEADQSALYRKWRTQAPTTEVIGVSALYQTHLETLLERVVAALPPHPPYYPKETLTDQPERFFAAELIRQSIFLHFKQEIPYSAHVAIEQFQNTPRCLRIHATIYVERLSQKVILIGRGGKALKRLGTHARKSLEEFFRKPVYLTHHITVLPYWRRDEKQLRKWGYL